ncbi:hypothetical protein AZE42_11526 [Rhizopogon vesiculosus]|uniref:Signal peptidase complex catalytic subunit SEC11 n=1 Tax=Rhizopogon vesiculosus TaxID=180088 RepID=A0A1J8Q3Q2_9AGAM|nr:hypothetical protein AZE42_11526 [Rhizopogon vesiculosus]
MELILLSFPLVATSISQLRLRHGIWPYAIKVSVCSCTPNPQSLLSLDIYHSRSIYHSTYSNVDPSSLISLHPNSILNINLLWDLLHAHTGSMEPAFYRGDLPFLTNPTSEHYHTSDVTVYRIPGADIPIVYRVMEIRDIFILFENLTQSGIGKTRRAYHIFSSVPTRLRDKRHRGTSCDLLPLGKSAGMYFSVIFFVAYFFTISESDLVPCRLPHVSPGTLRFMLVS